MVIFCKYNDCEHRQELVTSEIPKECPNCCGHWLEEDEDYTLFQNDNRQLIGCILICTKTRKQQEFKIDNKEKVFGREDFDFIDVRKSYISKVHFCLTIDNNQLFVEDLDSTNGTFIHLVKKSSVASKTVLQNGEYLILGQEEFLVKYLHEQIFEPQKTEHQLDSTSDKILQCVECGGNLETSDPCICSSCGTWNE